MYKRQLVDIEYAVQYLQVMHGHKYPILRTPNSMQALAGLVECGLVTRQDGETLRKAYLFIRMLIDLTLIHISEPTRPY